MKVTPTTDLTPLVGVPVQALHTNHAGTHLTRGVIHELHHGTNTRPEHGITNGVHGRMTVAPSGASTWFYWPYGCHITTN